MTLTYQNNTTFKSSFGGLLTIASITFVGIYFLLLLVEVLDRSKVIVVNSQDFRNILFDRRIYPLTQEVFDLAIEPVYLGTNASVLPS